MRKALPLLLGMGLVMLAGTSWGQRTAPWRVYKMADGLNEPAFSSVTLGSRGRVLARQATQPYLIELDGFNIRKIPIPGRTQSRAYQSPSGQIWTAATNGLYEYRAETWILHRVPEIAAAMRDTPPPSYQVPLWPVRQGLVLFLLPDKLMELNVEGNEGDTTRSVLDASQTQLGGFTGMTLSRAGGLWVSGLRGIAKVVPPLRSTGSTAQWEEFVPPADMSIQDLSEPREDESGTVSMIAHSTASSAKRIARFDGRTWTAEAAPAEGISVAWRSADSVTWAINAHTLFVGSETEVGKMVPNEELAARDYLDAAVEPRGSFWLATSDGLFRYSPPLWRTPARLRDLNTTISGLVADNRDGLWFLAGKELHQLRDGSLTQYALPIAGPRSLQNTRAAYVSRSSRLVFGVDGDLLSFDLATATFNRPQNRENHATYRALGAYLDEGLCVQAMEPPGVPGRATLEVFDGLVSRPLVEAPPELGPKLGFYVARNGDYWLSAENGVACYHERKWQLFPAADRTSPEGGVSFAEMPDGKIWCATQDRIWEYDGRNWTVLRGGFDRIERITRSRDGTVWVASNSGLQRFARNAWVENAVEDGLPSTAIREVMEDPRGRIWVATSYGLSLYHPEADMDPPQTAIEELSERDKKLPENGNITISFEGKDKWKFTSRHRLLFSYRLDEREWSDFEETSRVPFSDLPAGNHYFQVRSMDRNGNIDPKPATIEFAVILPWFKEQRLLAITTVGLATALFFAGLAFNRHRRLLRSYAEVERKVAERTRELEIANRELMHSQKMTALGTLAAGIAHDFNNILSIIKGSAQIIEDNLGNQEKVRTRVDRIKTVVDQGAGIVKAMLGFSRDSHAQQGICDVTEVVKDTVRLLGDRFLREVQVTVQNGAPPPPVVGSKDFIQQILLNFIFNAAEAITDRNELILATGTVHQLSKDLVLMPAQAKAYVTISVKDFGCGIAPENLPRIFEPFFTTKAFSTRRGTGLGLSMVYQLAEKLRAGLAVSSVLNEGSTFTLILPAFEPPVPETPGL